MFITTKCVDKRNIFDMIKNDEEFQKILFDEQISEFADRYLIVHDMTKIAHSFYVPQCEDECEKTKYKASKISIQYIINNKYTYVDDFGVFEWVKLSYKLVPDKTEKYQQFLYNKFGNNYLKVLKDYSNDVFSYQLDTINTSLYFDNLIQNIQKEVNPNKKVKSFCDEINLSKTNREAEQAMRLASIENLASLGSTRVIQ